LILTMTGIMNMNRKRFPKVPKTPNNKFNLTKAG
jgi:hypothetical protein